MSAVTGFPSSLADLTWIGAKPAWYLDLVHPQVGGGQGALRSLSRIEDAPNATALKVIGLDQRAFEVLVTRYGAQFSGLYFWKCPRIADLTPLENLPNLTHVAFYWNQRAENLWSLAKTPRLRGLQFDDFRRIRRLDEISAAVSLEELEFGDQIWVKAAFESLEPLVELQQLRKLSFAVRRIEDGRVEPLARLQRLEFLECPSNLFTTEQLAWLRARLPPSAQGRVLLPVQQLARSLPGSEKDVLIMGKRKPWLSSTADAPRIRRYTEDFWRMVEHFRAHPESGPNPAPQI